MDIARIATARHSTKAFDPNKRIVEARLEQLKTLLRFSPSSINSQPWHFFIVGSEAGRGQLARATTGPYGANGAKLLNASHVVVLCARTSFDDGQLQRVLEQEQADGRFDTPEAEAATHRGRGFYVKLHNDELHDTPHWLEKQVYIALGTLLLGAAALEIDACPIEGFDRALLDEVLGLGERGLASVVLVALGYRSEGDFNAGLPKSRLPAEEIFTLL